MSENTVIGNNPVKAAEAILLAPNDITQAALFETLADIHNGRDLTFADLYLQHECSESWSLEEGIVKSGEFNVACGVGVRAVNVDKQAFSYADEITLPALRQAAQVVRAIGRQGQSRSAGLIFAGLKHDLYRPLNPLDSLTDDEKVRLLERIEQRARAQDARVVQVIASLAGSFETIMVARSDGRLAAEQRPLTRLSLTVIVEENGRREQGHAGGGGRFGYEYFSDDVLDAYVRQAVTQATLNLDARPAPAGLTTVVLGPGWPGILLHEAIGHGLEGDFNRKGTSAFSGRIGEQVAAPGITVVDDGTIPLRRGSLNMDDEGEPTKRTVLIEDGILRGYLFDEMNARLMNAISTGNARRESFAHLPMPRMTNTMMENGGYDSQEIIASVEDGLYAANFGGGQVDITSGQFVFSTAEAWKIEKGKLSYPVKGATLIGHGPEVLKRVSMIGNDLALDGGIGTCGKDGQSVPVGVGQPTLKIDELVVGGTDQ